MPFSPHNQAGVQQQQKLLCTLTQMRQRATGAHFSSITISQKLRKCSTKVDRANDQRHTDPTRPQSTLSVGRAQSLHPYSARFPQKHTSWERQPQPPNVSVAHRHNFPKSTPGSGNPSPLMCRLRTDTWERQPQPPNVSVAHRHNFPKSTPGSGNPSPLMCRLRTDTWERQPQPPNVSVAHRHNFPKSTPGSGNPSPLMCRLRTDTWERQPQPPNVSVAHRHLGAATPAP